MKELFAFLLISSLNGVVTQGSILFIGNETNSTTLKWAISNSNPSVSLEFVNQTYQLVLLQAIDLDVTNPGDVCNAALQNFQLTVSCNKLQGDPVDEYISFHVSSANEYQPVADKSEPIRIQEGEMPTPIFIKRLFNMFKDRDCPKETPMISISMATGETDAGEYFTVNKTSGYLHQIKNFDYEETSIQCNLGKTGGVLNITATDGPHSISKLLNVIFVDVDDSPPVFVRSDCSTTCYTCPVSNISVTIYYFDQGIIKTEPTGIKALDPDTPQSNITYSLDVYPEEYKDNIEFENGSFILNQSFANFSNFNEPSDFSVVIILRATGSNGQNSDNFTLTVNVTVPPTTTPEPTTEPTTTPPTTTEEVTSQPTTMTPTTPQPSTTTPAPTTTAPIANPNPDASTDNKVLIIVLPIVAALVLISVLVIIYKTRKSQPQQKYKLGENGINGDAGHNDTSTEMDNPTFKGEKEGV
ncbi:uncharacterized protein LOC133186566 [Saccostrea echinata]|uniref:uncharacterized protein LOC133186566 n=1 Tax=Saccostrea echinata TaxID=191078 RepID=UPI002A83C97A|nr:uncharacterized protein LOC133186566 [Saccostrea echinata]